MNGYDVIGDIHGQADKLRALRKAMGYVSDGTGYRAPHGHQAVFVGDLIDRGPEQLAVLNIIRRMIDGGQARMVLGNHEFNAIGYATRDPRTGEYLRPRTDKKRRQHERFLAEVGEDTDLVDLSPSWPMGAAVQAARQRRCCTAVSAVPRIPDSRGNVDRRTECHLADAERAHARRRRTTANAALRSTARRASPAAVGGHANLCMTTPSRQSGFSKAAIRRNRRQHGSGRWLSDSDLLA